MVEAAIALPILILVILSMVMLMIHDYDCHQAQIKLHRELTKIWDQSSAVFDIEKKPVETSSKINGLVDQWMEKETESRIYVFSPSKCIRLGEMLSFDEE